MKKIIWEKWVDPFGDNMEETKWNHYDDEDLDEDTQLIENHIPTNKAIKVIASPLGLIPYNEYTASSKIFNFWIGHTNFNISENIKSTIETIDGVEILDVFTRYRFRIAIGKCFDDAEVMNHINIIVYEKFTE